MALAILYLLFLLPLVFSAISDVSTLGRREMNRIIHDAVGKKGASKRALGRSLFRRRSTGQARGESGPFTVTGNISLPVQFGRPATLSCNGNKALGLCVFKPPFAKRPWIFTPGTQHENGRIRMSERSGGDARMCEILVDKVEKKDLGKWRCVARCSCGSPKGIVFTLSETPTQPANDETEKGPKMKNENTIVLSSTAEAAERQGSRLGEFVEAGEHGGRPYYRQRDTEENKDNFLYSEGRMWLVSDTLGGSIFAN